MRSGPAALAASLLLAPAAAPASAGKAKNPDTYVFVGTVEAQTLDPISAYNGAEIAAARSIYEGLIDFDGESMTRFVPVLASEVPTRQNGLISEDGTVFRFPIRKDVRFHDGSLLTPEDVRYSLLRFILYDRSGSPSFLLLDPLLGLSSTRGEDGKLLPDVYERAVRAVRVEGDDLVLTLPRPFAGFLPILAAWGTVQSKAWCVRHGEWDGRKETLARYNDGNPQDSYLHEHVNGTGPYALERWDRANRSLILARTDDYRGGPARLKRAVFRSIEDFNTRLLLLKGGDADAIFIDHTQAPLVRNLPGVRVSGGHSILMVNAVIFNFDVETERNPFIGSGRLDGEGIPPDFFADKDVRLGFAYSVDYDAVVEELYAGHGEAATGLVPRGLLGHRDAPHPFRQDLKKAEEHFRRARGGELWDKGFLLCVAFPASWKSMAGQAQQLRRSLSDVNPKFRLELRPLETMAVADHMKARRIPLQVGGWRGDYGDAHNFAHPFIHSRGYFQNYFSYKNPEADTLIEEAVREPDEAKRAALYDRLNEMVFRDVPMVFTVSPTAMRVERTWLKGFRHNPLFVGSPYYSPVYPLSKD